MKELVIHQDKIDEKDLAGIIGICPFGALEEIHGTVEINAGCKMCGICVKKGPQGVFELREETGGLIPGTEVIDKNEWKGIAVYLDQVEGDIHPVSFELIGKARELAAKVGHKIYALCMGYRIARTAETALDFGVDELFVYDQPELEFFRIEPYTAAFEEFVKRVKPSVCLVGGTTLGRSLAPRTAARFRTGLTADCTILDIKENTDLDQIRPAFGGNIMAHIHTPKHRPQFATVRYKIFNPPAKISRPTGHVHLCRLEEEKLKSGINVLEVRPKKRETGIEEAEVLVVAGRGIRKEGDLAMIEELAEALGGQTAGTRSLIEEGWVDPRKQIGLSGRTVKPRLIITCGVSGAIQFVAGMNSSENIIAINTDRNAPIMKVAHTAIAGDLYEIIPVLLERINAPSGLAGVKV